jgi:hypothetical protein
VTSIQTAICQAYQVAYRTWKAGIPPPVKVPVKNSRGQVEHNSRGQVITREVPRPYKSPPPVPHGCTPQGTSG